MRVEYALTEEDAIALVRHQVYRLRQSGKGTPVTWIMLGFVFLMSLLFIVSAPDSVYSYIPALLFAAIWAYYFLAPWIAVQRMKRVLRQPATERALGQRQSVLITPESLTHTTEEATGRRPWSDVGLIDATEHHAFFFWAGNTVLIGPGRAFANEKHFGEFISTARRFQREALKPLPPA